MKDDFSHNLRELRGQILEACEEYDRDADDITIVAVTKRQPLQIVHMALAAGLHNIGESRVQEAEEKIPRLGGGARFHMVGHLQTNKVKKAIDLFDVIQSVDSLKLAEEIEKEAAKRDRAVECLIEVNCSGEDAKFGIPPNDCIDLVKQVHEFEHIRLAGLMTIAPLTDDKEQIRAAFSRCRELYRQGEDIVGDDFDTLSMGMSSDFALAIAEGSTMIRVGTALFGPRPED